MRGLILAVMRRADGDGLRYWRKRRGLTLKKLHEKSGVSYATISRIETGATAEPLDDTMQKLAHALEIDVDVLWIYGNPPRREPDPDENGRAAGGSEVA
jgi:transcriptional regulator with XRE-family HTH domain